MDLEHGSWHLDFGTRHMTLGTWDDGSEVRDLGLVIYDFGFGM